MTIKNRATVLCLSLFGSLSSFAQITHDYQVGPQYDGSAVVATNQIVTPAGTQVSINGRPVAVAIRPDQQTAAVLNSGASYNLPAAPLVIVDLKSGAIKQQFTPPNSVSASYDGVIYSKDGKRLYFSQDSGTVIVADVGADGTLTLNTQIAIPQGGGGVNNGGLALSTDGKTLYVVLNMANAIGVIDLKTNRFTGQIAVQNAPKSIVISANTAYVTNEGGRPPNPGEFFDYSAGTPITADPDSAASITGTVSVVDLPSQTVVKNILVGLHPTAVLLHGRYVFVANTNSDSISVIDTSDNRVIATTHIEVFSRAPLGSSPNGLAMTKENQLVVSLGANNALALYDWTDTRRLHFQGFVPTAWYPSYVSVANAQRQTHGTAALPERLIVANTKGTGVGSNVPDFGTPSGKNTHSLVGSVSLIPVPTKVQFKTYNTQVAANNGWSTRNDHEYTPRPFGSEHPIKHVIYVIKENRTYDQILGDDPRGNGDPLLVEFGLPVTPNQHALADNFVLFDNFYDSGILSADGHQWTDQAFAPDYIEKQFTDFNRSYPYNGGDPLVYNPTGFLWEDAVKHGKSVRTYGEYAYQFNGPNQDYGDWTSWYNDSLILEGKKKGTLHVPIGDFQAHSDVPSNDRLLNHDFPPFDTEIPDQYRLDIFLRDWKEYVKHKNLPNLIVMTLCTDHTSGVSAGFPTPAAQVADNDLAVGRLVDEVSHSPYWSSTAIFFVEDDPQAGVDHVDGHRSTAFIVSPWVQHNQINHTYYTQINFVRTIEELLGLPPMNQHDLLAPAMKDAFSDTPDLAPFTFLPNQIPLDTLTPASQAALQKAWQNVSARIFPHGTGKQPDTADPNLLNHAIWYATKGFNVPYPGDTRILYPKELAITKAPEAEDR